MADIEAQANNMQEIDLLNFKVKFFGNTIVISQNYYITFYLSTRFPIDCLELICR